MSNNKDNYSAPGCVLGVMIFSAILLLILGVPSNLLVIVLGLQFLILLVSVVATLSNGDYQLETDNNGDTGEPSAPEYAVVDDGKVKAIEYQGFVRDADALSSTNAGTVPRSGCC